MPVYNGARYIAKALASVLEQTSPAAEILVVDDGSDDDTAAIAESMGATVVRQPQRRGVSAARNTGIARASESWIAFLDADDLWRAQKLERQWRAVSAATDCGFCFTDYYECDENDVDRLPSLFAEHWNYPHVVKHEIGDRMFRCDTESLNRAQLQWNFIQPSALLVRKDVVTAVGGFDGTLTHYEDYELYLRLYRAANAVVIEIPLTGYRRHGAQASRDLLKAALNERAVAERVLAQPSRYLELTAAHYRKNLPRLVQKCGYWYLRGGDFSNAKKCLGASFRMAPSPRVFFLWLASVGLDNPVARMLYPTAKAIWRPLKPRVEGFARALRGKRQRPKAGAA